MLDCMFTCMSCFHSYTNFILYSCLYVNLYITLWLSIHSYSCVNLISFLFFVTFFLFWGALFRFYLCNPFFLHFYCYRLILIIFQYEVSLQQTINQQTPSMKPNQWRWIQVAWISCCIMTSGGAIIATMISPIYENKQVTDSCEWWFRARCKKYKYYVFSTT